MAAAVGLTEYGVLATSETYLKAAGILGIAGEATLPIIAIGQYLGWFDIDDFTEMTTEFALAAGGSMIAGIIPAYLYNRASTKWTALAASGLTAKAAKIGGALIPAGVQLQTAKGLMSAIALCEFDSQV